MGAHTPGSDGCTLLFQTLDQEFVQVVGGRDDRIRKTCVVQHLAGFLGKIGKVAAVQAYAVERERNAGLTHLGKDADGIRNTGF